MIKPGGMPESVSVVVCAYTLDRFDDLAAGVTEAARQIEAAGISGEVLVIIDHNPDLLAQATTAFAEIATVAANERHQGLSGARNTGVEMARGEIVAFLDDDACPRPGWLTGLLHPYQDPQVVAVGGRAVPRWPEAGRPMQLPSALPEGPGEFDWVVGCTYAGQPTDPQPVRNLMGCSMSFRADTFGHTGGFAEDLGRVGTVPLGCEETELCIRAVADDPGARIIFNPESVIDHRVTPGRITWGYFWSRCYAEGISKAAVAVRATAGAALSTEASYVRKVLPKGLLRELARVPRGIGTGTARRALGGAAAIVGGLGVTGVGYLAGRIRLRHTEITPAPRLRTLTGL